MLLLIVRSLITLSNGSGIYGYGVIDGQGGKHIVEADGSRGPSWWDLIDLKKTDACSKAHPVVGPNGETCLEGSPHMVVIGNNVVPASNVALYKITLRSPPMEAVTVKGSNATLWGVKVQAPWNRGNTGALNLDGSDMLVMDNILSVGDQDIAIEGSGAGTSSGTTSNILINGLRVYSRAGIALLEVGQGFSNILVNDFAMTGDVPSFVLGSGADPAADASVNGVSAKTVSDKYGISIYHALPGSLSDSAALQLFTGSATAKPHSAQDISFKNACIADVAVPINVQPNQPGPGVALAGGLNTGTIGPVAFNNISVLPPSPQFVQPKQAGGTTSWVTRLYDFEMVGNSGNPSRITFNNMVYGKGQSAEQLLGAMDVENNSLLTLNNVFPALFNRMVAPSGSALWKFVANSYIGRAEITSPKPAFPCPAGIFPFVTGELYADLQGMTYGSDANLQTATVVQPMMVTLDAVVQPTMSQSGLYIRDANSPADSTVAIPTPPLKGLVYFFDNGNFIGNAALSANGTLAMFTIPSISAGTHAFTAVYMDPPDKRFYAPLAFGKVVISVAQR